MQFSFRLICAVSSFTVLLLCQIFIENSSCPRYCHFEFLTQAPKAGVIAVAYGSGHKAADKTHAVISKELIRFWGYPSIAVSIAMLFQIFGYLNLRLFHRPKPCIDFHQIFRTCLAPNNLQLIRFRGVSGNYGNTLQFWGS